MVHNLLIYLILDVVVLPHGQNFVLALVPVLDLVTNAASKMRLNLIGDIIVREDGL